MRNDIPKRFSKNIVERPELTIKSRITELGSVYDDLAASLKVIDASTAITLTTQEATALFGKGFKNNIRAQTKKRGCSKVHIAVKEDKVYIWQVKI